MKRIIPIFYILFSSLISQSQTFNRAFHGHLDDADNLVRINNNYYFSLLVQTPGSVDSSFICFVSNTGHVRFKKWFFKDETTEIIRVITTLDNNLLFLGFSHKCDYFGPTSQNFLIKLDTNGNVIFDKSFVNTNNNNLPRRCNDIVQHSDSSFYSVSHNVLLHFNKDGNHISSKSTPVVSPTAMLRLANGHFLVAGTSGSWKHFEIDTNGTALIQATSSSYVWKYGQSQSGTIFALNDGDTLTKLTASLVKSGKLGLNLGGNDFIFEGDTMRCVGRTANNLIQHFKLDTAFNVYSQFTSPSGLVFDASICNGPNDKIAFLTNCISRVYPVLAYVGYLGTYVGITEIVRDQPYSYSKDIGVISTELDSGFVTTSYGAASNQVSGYYRFKVTIKNFGADVINNFWLNTNFYDIKTCGIDYYHEYFSGLTLGSQATMTVTTPFIYHPFAATIGTPVPQSVVVKNICFYTTIPNNCNDVDYLNDESCISPTVELVTGLPQVEAEFSTFKVFPNPFENVIRIESEHQIKGVELLDLTGRSILVLEGDHKTIQLNDLKINPGLYLIRIQTDKGIITKKVVKN